LTACDAGPARTVSKIRQAKKSRRQLRDIEALVPARWCSDVAGRASAIELRQKVRAIPIDEILEQPDGIRSSYSASRVAFTRSTIVERSGRITIMFRMLIETTQMSAA
jgi:hypothetical protein